MPTSTTGQRSLVLRAKQMFADIRTALSLYLSHNAVDHLIGCNCFFFI
jgi:hypothetical protein